MISEKYIKIFGLGVALILLVGSLLHALHLHLGILSVLIIFGSILFIIEKSLTWPWLFGIVYAMASIFSILTYSKNLPTIGVLISDILSVLFLGVSILRWQILIPLYNLWMKGAQGIGLVVTACILTTVYLFVFTPVRVLLRLLGKDHLQRTIDHTLVTYWQKRDKTTVSKESYHQQF